MRTEGVVKVDEREISLKGLNKINLILGRTGCGKSRLLKSISKQLGASDSDEGAMSIYHVEAERGGRVDYERSEEDADNFGEKPPSVSGRRASYAQEGSGVLSLYTGGSHLREKGGSRRSCVYAEFKRTQEAHPAG